MLTTLGMKDFLDNSTRSSSPSNMSNSSQPPAEDEKKPDGSSNVHTIGQSKPKGSSNQTPIQTPLQTPPERGRLQDPIDLVSQTNRHSTQGHGPGVSQHSPQLQTHDQQTLSMSFPYTGPPYLYDQNLSKYERSATSRNQDCVPERRVTLPPKD